MNDESPALSVQRCISGRAIELICGHESLLALRNLGVFPILDASFKRARLICCLDDRGPLCARSKQRLEPLYVSSAAIGVRIGLMSACVVMQQRRRATATRQGWPPKQGRYRK